MMRRLVLILDVVFYVSASLLFEELSNVCYVEDAVKLLSEQYFLKRLTVGNILYKIKISKDLFLETKEASQF